MNEQIMLEMTERYLRGEMGVEEKMAFEKDRRSNPELDQFVVSHDLFLRDLKHYGHVRKLKHQLHETHTHLTESGKIRQVELGRVAKMELFWKRYKRTISIAASIAGVIAISTSSLITLLAPKGENKQVQELANTVNQIKLKQSEQDNRINSLTTQKVPNDKVVTGSGTGFLIDGKGILVTSAHILRNAKSAVVTNQSGQEFRANILFTDATYDISVLQINDEDYKSQGQIPYGIRKNQSELAEPIFTIGYPDNKFVYGEGYLSSHTGFNGDTLSCQIAVAANPGNSGGPVFNRNGEIIGILSKREIQADGVVYAIRSKYIGEVISTLTKKDSTVGPVKLPSASSIRGIDKTQQVKRIQSFIYMVKGF